MHNNSLRGLRVLLTRQHGYNKELAGSIARHNGIGVELPLLDICSTFSLKLLQPIKELVEVERILFIFTSRNAAEIVLPELIKINDVSKNHTFAAIGPATANYIKMYGIKDVICPGESPFNSEALALYLDKEINKSIRWAYLFAGHGGRLWLPQYLISKNIKVEIIEVYRRVMPKIDTNLLRVSTENLDVILITCATSLQHWKYLLEQANINISGSWPLLVVSQRICDIAKKMGFHQIRVSASVANDDIINALSMGP